MSPADRIRARIAKQAAIAQRHDALAIEMRRQDDDVMARADARIASTARAVVKELQSLLAEIEPEQPVKVTA